MPIAAAGHVAPTAEARVHANGIDLAYQAFGDPADPAMVLVMGLGAQMIAWPDELCAGLAARGHYVVRFDNRDVGRSTHLDALPIPRLADVLLGRPPPYTIGDMADDAVGLLDGLGLGTVHLVGASMGGFIAQTVALHHPRRVRSLTLMMTSTGSRLVGWPSPRVLPLLGRRRAVASRDDAIAIALDTFGVIGSPGFATDEAYLADTVGRAWDRGMSTGGYLRHLAALAAQPNRTRALRSLRLPTLVVHGLHDRLVAPSGGLAIARAVPGARFVGFSGMGHDLPRPLWPDLEREIAALAASADRSGAAV